MTVRKAFGLLGAAALIAMVGWFAIGLKTGIRYPMLQHEPGQAASRFESGVLRVVAHGAYVESGDAGAVRLRAFMPHPAVSIESDSAQALSLLIGNVHPDARLIVPSVLEGAREQVDGLERRLTGTLAAGGRGEIRWQFPRRDRYRFAAIGDTGAGQELSWCLHRAAELGADFIVHLGDIYYPPNTLDEGRSRFDRARVPVYVAIGNHDFHRGLERLPTRYTRLFGPRNFSFRLLDTEFVNLDTAASTFPVSGADRGRLMATLTPLGAPGTDLREYLIMTHRPLVDPRPGRSHDVGGREARWLRDRLEAIGATTIIAGHIHRSLESRDGSMATYIAGDGLADVDLVTGEAVARILIGDLARGEPLALHWEPLNMPLHVHCHPDARESLSGTDRAGQLAGLAAACAGKPGWE